MRAKRELPSMPEKIDSVEQRQKLAHTCFSDALNSPREQEIYSKDREHLLTIEGADAWDRFARQGASVIEKKAAIIIWHLREYERDFIFGNIPGEALPESWTLDMGGQFLTNKKRIEKQSKLFKISQMVPKGALLHLHFNAELHPERLLQEARTMENMFIRSTQPILTDKDLIETEIVFNVMPDSTPSNMIFEGEYLGNKDNWRPKQYPEMQSKIWMLWSEFREQFERNFPGRYVQKAITLENGPINSAEQGKVHLKPAENWVKQKMVLSKDEAYDPSQTVNGYVPRSALKPRTFGLTNYTESGPDSTKQLVPSRAYSTTKGCTNGISATP
jgi:adenosine deaminase CECR1